MAIKKPIIQKQTLDVSVVEGETLHELSSVFGALFNHSPDSVIVVDSQLNVVFANSKLLRFIQQSMSHLLGLPAAEILSGTAFYRSVYAYLQKAIKTKQSFAYTKLHNPVEARYNVVSVTPISDDDTLLGAFVTIQEAQLELSLANQDAKRRDVYQRTLIDNIPFIIWLKDKDSRILAANTAFADAAGVSSTKQLEGKTDKDFWPEKMAEGYMEDDARVIASGEPVHLVEQVQRAEKGLAWLETYKAPVIVDDQVIGTIGYAKDITEERKVDVIVAQKELEYSALIKKLPLSIIRYDLQCRRIFVNMQDTGNAKATDDMLGKTPEEAWSSRVTNMTGEGYQAKLMHVLYHGESQSFELECDSSGETQVLLVNILPEFDDGYQVTGALAIASDITEITQYRNDLEFMAYHDSLTGLPNRALLNQRLKAAATEGNHFGLMFMDLDFFKSINDTLGHVVGDALLLEVAGRILHAVRNDDLVARIGGDEFAVVVTNLKHDADLAILADKIAETLAQPFNIEGINFFVTASIGVASYPHDSEVVEDLVKYADTAMYEAKKKGRNNHQFYTPEFTESAMEHLAIATALRYAIEKDELSLLYQPKVEIGSGKILGAETLLRWHGKVLGQIRPDKFIPIAEESGLIIEIGAWVLHASCQAAVQLNQHRQEPLNVAVNISSKEFAGNDFIQNLEKCLQVTGCRPEWITLEITESLLLDDTNKALETLSKIDKMGIKLSIDDFGTGYSALAYLSKFPIRQVKIDRSFVKDIIDNQNSALLIQAIIAMADSLNKELVAEGIETKEQAALIQAYGCDQGQGYLYSRPVAFSEFLHMAAQQKIH